MMLLKSLRNAALAVMLLSAGAANAALLNFNLTGGYTASWQLDSALVPDASEDGVGFLFYDVEGNFPDSFFDVADLTFYSAAIGGGLEIYDYYSDTYLLSTDGPQMYTGAEDSPMFSLGTYFLTEYLGTQTYTLTIALADAGPGPGEPSDVPEPASAALLLAGVGVMAALRKRKVGIRSDQKMALAA